MRLPRRGSLLVLATALPLAGASPGTAGAADAVLRLDGVGPLELGMKRSEALATGWLNARGRGCELGGPPVPITYSLAGPRAPQGLRGVAEFRGHRLRNLSFTRGVRTVRGVTVGRTTHARMVRRYRTDGYSASAEFVDVFQATFVSVRLRGKDVLSGFGSGAVVTTLGIPYVPVCE